MLTVDSRHPHNKMFSTYCDTANKTNRNNRNKNLPTPRNLHSALFERQENNDQRFESGSRNQRTNVNI